MDTADIKTTAKGKRALSQEIASRHTDPNFYGALNYLPNPDEILRKLGKSQEVYDAITTDAHVMGELRSVRAGLIKYETRLQAGGEDPADLRALELCEQYMKQRPAPGMQWIDAYWNMAKAAFRGFAPHEVVWAKQDGYLLPEKIIDRPQRRFVFGIENDLRLITRDHMMDGIELGPKKFLLTRHMPSFDNPYGVALFSACFWPYTFKHNGYKYFVKFCEKYGMPWALGKYPVGTPEKEQKQLLEGLQQMVEDAVGTAPEGSSVELIEAKHSGKPVQAILIEACNKEMSKALTSQTLASEIGDQGSRAASETHREREESVNDSDRIMICDTMNELFAWITELNIPNAKPPTHEFYEESEVSMDEVEKLDKARHFIDIPAAYAHDRLQIPMPQEGEEVLPRTGSAPAPSEPGQQEFNRCPGCGQAHDFNQHGATNKLTDQAVEGADELIASLIEPIRKLLENSHTLEDFRDGLIDLYPDINETQLGEYTSLALQVGALDGMEEAK